MKPVVFAGPTLAATDIRKLLDATVLPPVAQGDVYRAAREKPPAIGIIDGYFDGVPSVWHKEILWAIEQGIAVFGSASMGALRAAELTDFGMIGVGTIFDAYLSGEISDDDEVAVLHAPAELGFASLSEPMVSVRATVERARGAGILTATAADLIISTAKALHYRDRTWDALAVRLAGEPGMVEFFAWRPAGQVDAKREDACAMLARMASFLGGEADQGGQQAHRTERTLVWKSLVRRIDAENTDQPPHNKGVLDELRLTPDRYEMVRDRAALRHFAVEQAARRGMQVGHDTLRALMDRHRRRHDLSRRDAVLRWLDENDLDEKDYEALLTETALIEETVTARSPQLDPHILAELRWSGDYCGLKQRADAKARVVDEETQAIASADRLRMLIWFFENRLGRAVPEDLGSYAASIGLADRDELFELIGREVMYCFNHSGERGAEDTD